MAAPWAAPQPPPRPPEPPAVLRARVLEATRALSGIQAPNPDAIGFNDAAAAIGACRLLARAAIASSSPSTSTSSISSTPEDGQALQHALQDALDLLEVAVAAAISSSSPSAFPLAAAALLLAGCSAAATAVVAPVAASSPAAAAAAAAAEAVTRALHRLAASPNAVVLFRDREAAADASAGVGRLAAAAAAAAASSPSTPTSSSSSAAASLLLLAFARLAAASSSRSTIDLSSEEDESLDSMLLVPVAHAAKMAASAAAPPALLPLLVDAAARAAAAEAPPSSSSSSSIDAAAASVASCTFLLSGLAEGAGPRISSNLPRELVEAVLAACERWCRNNRHGHHHRRPASSPFLFLERDAAAAAAAAVAEAGALPLSPPSRASDAAAVMTPVLVSLLCEGRGPLDLSRELFGAAARRLPPERAAEALLTSGASCFAKAAAPRAARALAVVAPLCPREEAARCLEGVALAARGLHERYAEIASDVFDVVVVVGEEGNGKKKTASGGGVGVGGGGASWLSSPALSKSGAIRGALDAAFFSCVAALRSLAVPAGALPLPSPPPPRNGNLSRPPPPAPQDPRATAAALDALALVSFARPPAPAQQLLAHSDLVAGLLEAAAAAASASASAAEAAPAAEAAAASNSSFGGVGAALAERIPGYDFFVRGQRWVSDALLATRAHFYLLCLAPAARGMSAAVAAAAAEDEGGQEEGTTAAAAMAAAANAAAATSKAAALALLYLGHPTSEALRGAAHGLCAALMDEGGPLSACPASSSRSLNSFAARDRRRRRQRRRHPLLLLLPGFLDRALDLRGGVRPHYPGLAFAVAAALRGCQGCGGETADADAAAAAAASLLVPRRLSLALRESLVLNPSSCSPSSSAALSPDSLALVSALASALLSVDARGFDDACAAVEAALLPSPSPPPSPSAAAAAAREAATTASSLPPLPLPLSAAAFDALGRALGSADDLLRKPALARWWARAASGVGVGAGR